VDGDAAVSVEIGGTYVAVFRMRMSPADVWLVWFRLAFIMPNFTGDGEPGDHRRSFDRGSR
jgi:hypothetical protein